MATPTSAAFAAVLGRYRLLEPEWLAELPALQARLPGARDLARELLKRGWLTAYQANMVLKGRGEELLLGSYVLLERVGEGGMGAVFKAQNWKLGRVVALKVIRKERLANADAVRRFQREVLAAAQLAHPNIVAAYDADQAGDRHFFVMEYVEGTDLAKLVKQRGPLPVADACDYVRQAALGLQHAYERGLVHRDIKPHNLLLARDGTVKILDMGLARTEQAAGEAETASTLTQEGAVMGTPDYIAPEQALDSRSTDVRADLYSLGCALYQLLAGRVPFPGGTLIQKVNRHQFDEPEPLEQLRADVPPAVAAVVRKLMAKRPQDRFQTPAELAVALATAAVPVAGGGVGRPAPNAAPVSEAPPTGQGGPTPLPDTDSGLADLAPSDTLVNSNSAYRRRREAEARRWLWINVAGGVLLLVLVILAAVLLLRRSAAPHPAPAPEPAPAPAPDPKRQAFERWAEGVARLDPDRQVEAVVRKLREDNPAYDAIVTPERTDGRLTGLKIVADQVTDLTALRAPADLRSLTLYGRTTGNRLADLTSLRGLPLTELRIGWSQVADLGPLAGMPLVHFECHADRVESLVPLRGMRLTEFECHSRAVADLAPLRGMPLRSLNCAQTAVASLAAVRDMPLDVLNCRQTPVASLGPLRGLPLTTLQCGSTKVVSLEPLAGMRLKVLQIERTAVRDLAPLAGLPLEALDAAGTPVADLRPLRGLPLRRLDLSATRVADLRPLADCRQLEWLACTGAPVAGWWPLAGLPLKELRGDFGGLPPDVAPLRRVETLVTINGQPAVEFWHAVNRRQAAVAAWAKRTGGGPSPLDGLSAARANPVGAGLPRETVAVLSRPGRPHRRWVRDVAFTPDGRTLASASWDGTLRLWRADAGTEQALLRGHTGVVNTVAFSPDGRLLASTGGDRTVRLWDVAEARAGATLRGHTDATHGVAFAPDGERLASASVDRTLRLWDVRTAAPGPVLRGHTDKILAVGFCADGRTLASAGFDKTLRLWDVAAAEPEGAPARHADVLAGLAFAPDGRTLATAGMTIRLWEVPGLRPRGTLAGHRLPVHAVAFAPGGGVLASGAGVADSDRPGELKLWDLASGQELASWRTPGAVGGLAFAPDGRHLAVGIGRGWLVILRLLPARQAG